jgi:hypothetical protein
MPLQAERISAQLRQRLSDAVAAAGDALVDGDNANGAAEPEVRIKPELSLFRSALPQAQAVCSGRGAGWHVVLLYVTPVFVQEEDVAVQAEMCML